MKFQTMSARTWSIVHFILLRINLQTRHNSNHIFRNLELKDDALLTILDMSQPSAGVLLPARGYSSGLLFYYSGLQFPSPLALISLLVLIVPSCVSFSLISSLCILFSVIPCLLQYCVLLPCAFLYSVFVDYLLPVFFSSCSVFCFFCSLSGTTIKLHLDLIFPRVIRDRIRQ